MIFHNKCKNKLAIDITGGYRFISPGISFTSKGVEPGVIEVIQTKARKSFQPYCPNCDEHLEGKDDLSNEIVCKCCLHDDFVPISDAYLVQNISQIVCGRCLEKCKKLSPKDEISNAKEGLYRLVSEMLSSSDEIGILTILMKSCK